MKKLILLFVVTLSTSLIINAQWNYINQENTGDYRVIKFNNESEGWAMGDSCFIQKTTDGGDTWIQVPCNGTANIEDFQFVNDSVAYCAGWNYVDNVNSEVLKYDFTNESWNVISSLDSTAILALHFLDPLTGFIVCGKSIRRTDDGGISWSTVWDASFVGYESAFPRDIIFINDSVGFVCGRLKSEDWELRRVILRTTDKGENWSVSYLDSIGSSHTIYRLNFVKDNPNFIYASTSSPYFFKTSDCGNSWEIFGSSIQKEYKPIYFVSADTGYAAATAMGTYTGGKVPFEIWRTTDGALTWDLQFVDSAYAQAANSIYFVNDTVGYVAGRQTMLKTENGGITSGIHLNEGINNMKVIVYPNPTNNYLNIQSLNSTNISSIEIINMQGKLVHNVSVLNDQNKIDVRDLEPGVYIVRIYTEKGEVVNKMIKQ